MYARRNNKGATSSAGRKKLSIKKNSISDSDLQPEEWRQNREAARARRLKHGRNAKIEKRQALLAAQQEFRKQLRRKPEYKERCVELEQLTVGDWFDGVVRKLRPHGAYVSIGTEIDGFVHVKDLRENEFVQRAEDVLFLGQEIRVCVKGVDPDTKRLSLSAVALDHTLTGDKAISSFTLNQRLTNVRIMRVTPYAAFVDVGAIIPAYLHVTDVGLLPRKRIGAPRVPRVQLQPGIIIPECWISYLDPESPRGLRISCLTPEERSVSTNP
eukprot:CAMPEP_0197290642 /NCGR_PEP_ID=MMETSP0890-20130614/8656_1 /TAXON_ID=44058 ORGANISM="Aureoumbra lagunensis, Strain CCMP1510" /NCGR_SAMPLE_ID=MMETSP0890 /ASSEMBLY_ACC=CAM_ASM_000533 /LENGTH=269 /DNA_ID=CAMNT_0042762769 /DNA_START=88 /DNA_END=898 /DNA_ORIENTATION=-